MSGITTHVLDTSRGVPAPGIPVLLELLDAANRWTPVASAVTDNDGRCRSLVAPGAAVKGAYRLRFDTSAYLGSGAFYPYVEVVFHVADPSRHHHIPLLLSPFGYSTYRGS